MTDTITAREPWLMSAVEELRPLLLEVKDTFLGEMRATEKEPHDLPPVRVSVGWPHRGGTANKGRVIGQCWKSSVALDGVSQVFISPVISRTDPVKVLGVLLHELIHAWDDCESGHRGRFARTARAAGLVGKMTCTEVGDELAEKFRGIIAKIGTYPHVGLSFEEMEKQRKPQSTRMLKLECPEDGYLVRTTAKWLDSMGYPKCPCGSEMIDG